MSDDNKKDDDENDLSKFIQGLNKDKRGKEVLRILRIRQVEEKDIDIKGMIDELKATNQKIRQSMPVSDEFKDGYESGYQAALHELLQTKEDAKNLVRLMLKVWDQDSDIG